MRRLVLSITVALGACGSDAGGGADVADTASDTTQEAITPTSPWTITLVEGERAGRQIQAAVLPNGTPIVASYIEGGAAQGLCYDDQPAGGDRVAWTLRYAEADGDGWRVEDVAAIIHLGAPRGFDLAVDGDGTPVIAALTGEPDAVARYCGANDVGLYRRGGAGEWAIDVAVATSNEAATGEPASDFGTVVGLWPALAYDADGAALVAYKDVHGGGLQGDDFTRADLEIAQSSGGGWSHTAIDWGKGAGDYNAAAFDRQGRPLVLQFNPRDDLQGSARGLWLMRSDDGGATFDSVRLFAGGVSERPSLAVDDDGGVWVAWYDGALGLPMVAHLADPELFGDVDDWDIEDVGDRVYDEGRHPSIAVSPGGTVALAYQRCGRASDGIGDCNPSRDAVVLAWRDGSQWEREIVWEEPDGLCGSYTTLVFAGEEPVVFYQCQVEAGEGFASELRAARRERL